MALLQTIQQMGQGLLGAAWLPVWTVVKILVIVLPIMCGVAYLTLAERKVLGWMQVRPGPNRVGPDHKSLNKLPDACIGTFPAYASATSSPRPCLRSC